jgi:hypothetical protein
MTKESSVFDNLETFAMFLGYLRSGHRLIGALLDAHPDIIMAHALDVLKYVAEGAGRRTILDRLLENSQMAQDAGRTWGNYCYAVPRQWQGRFRKLRVIGDKGGGSLKRFRSDPQLLERLRQTIGLNVKFLHIVRNPYDTISSMARHREQRGAPLAKCIESYFARSATFAQVKKQIDDGDLLEIRYESFLEDPGARLRELCRVLGVEAPDDYLTACANIIHESPHQSRHEVPWTKEMINVVQKQLAEYPFLAGYAYPS